MRKNICDVVCLCVCLYLSVLWQHVYQYIYIHTYKYNITIILYIYIMHEKYRKKGDNVGWIVQHKAPRSCAFDAFVSSEARNLA